METKKVCICIPCYNNEKTIRNTLDSVVKQKYKNIVIKVFDNASSDSTRDIVSEYIAADYPIILFERENTVSGEENFNTCIKNSEGEFTAIFHADDVYHDSIISKQVDFLTRNVSCHAASTHANIINENSFFIGERFVPSEFEGEKELVLSKDEFAKLTFKYGNFITCPSVLFKTETLKNKIISFRGESFKSSSDLDVWFRLTDHGSLGFINEPLINYRESNVSFSYNLAKVRVERHDLFLVLDNYIDNFLGNNEDLSYLKEYMSFLLMKDTSNINLNRYILGISGFEKNFVLKNYKKMFASKFHFKFFIISIGIEVLIKLPRIFVTLVKNLKGKV